MNYNDILENAKMLMNGNCKVCPVCDGRACSFTMPGPGCKPPSNTAARNYSKWQDIFLNMDNICAKAPIDITTSFFGRKFEMPIFAAPIGVVDIHYSTRYTEAEYNTALVSGCGEKGVGACYWCGYEDDLFRANLEALKKAGGYAIPAIKPFSNEKFKRYVDLAREYDTPAILMDIDGAGLPMFKEHCDDSGCKTVESLRELREYAGDLPFILKGIMTVSGARKAREAGFDTIVVSNHGGRVLSCVPSTAEVLPEICEAAGEDMTVFVDGGIRSGYDVFKALALGADGVLIGRPIPISIIGGGKEGVGMYLDKIAADLRDAMEMCGAHSLSEIDRHMVRIIK